MTPGLKSGLLLTSLFLLGGVAGGGVGYALAQRQVAALIEEPRPELMRERRLRGLARELDLSPEQRGAIGKLMRDHHAAQAAAREAMLEQCGQAWVEQRARVHAEIEALLTPQQRQRFNSLLARRGPGWGAGAGATRVRGGPHGGGPRRGLPRPGGGPRGPGYGPHGPGPREP